VRRRVKRIICIGNRYQPEDAAGPLVYEYLSQTPLPPDVDALDGGLAGLDLLRFVEQAERVVFIDAWLGPELHERVAVFAAAEIERAASDTYGHAAGLAYMLRAWRNVADGPLPETWVVGISGVPDRDTVRAAAELSLSIARDGCDPGREAVLQLAGGRL
jgi:hydrogenase maturation protease